MNLAALRAARYPARQASGRVTEGVDIVFSRRLTDPRGASLCVIIAVLALLFDPFAAQAQTVDRVYRL
jgi:hypothetical protein